MHVTRVEEGITTLKIVTAKPTGRRPIGSPRHRWEDNIIMDHKELRQ
jgi:hypothetical protein